MRFVGLDVGTKRLGVALSDEMGWTAQPFAVIEGKSPGGMTAKLKTLMAAYSLDAVIIGLPLNMNGTEGPSAELARKLAECVEREMQVKVVLWDERLTTVAAERVLLEGDVRRKKRKENIDKIAAAMILQGWLDGRESRKV